LPSGGKSTKGNQKTEIKRAGWQDSAKGPSDWFAGTVRIDPLFQASEPAFVRGASVTFEAGAWTARHTPTIQSTPRKRPNRVYNAARWGFGQLTYA